MRLPLSTPCFSTACSVYSEQLGVNLQERGSMGETKSR
jgi:hypothetical protein